MKTITDTQKKWALTATLVAALGCSLSFNPAKHGVMSLDLASSSESHAEVEIEVGNQTFNAHMLRTGAKRTTVVVSPQATEGQANCSDCEKTYAVDLEFKNDEDTIRKIALALEKELKQDAAKTEVQEARPRRVVIERGDREIEEEEMTDREKAEEDYKKLVRSGEGCRQSDRADKNSCMVDRYLRDLRGDKIEPLAAYGYFKKKLEPQMTRMLLDRTINRDDMEYTNANAALDEIDKLISGLSENYNSVLERVYHMQAETIRKSAEKQRSLLEEAIQTRSGRTRDEAFQQEIWTRNLHANFRSIGNPDLATSAILTAVDNGAISYDEARSLFQRSYDNIANSIYNGTLQWNTVAASSPDQIRLGNYEVPQYVPFRNYFGLDGVTEGSAVLPAPGSTGTRVVRDRLSGRISLESTSVVGVTSDGRAVVVIAPEVLQNNTSGLAWGTTGNATQEALRARQAIRDQFGLSY